MKYALYFVPEVVAVLFIKKQVHEIGLAIFRL
jgi:hypothetical protein